MIPTPNYCSAIKQHTNIATRANSGYGLAVSFVHSIAQHNENWGCRSKPLCLYMIRHPINIKLPRELVIIDTVVIITGNGKLN